MSDYTTLIAKLDRAHRMSCSDPDDPTRETFYSMARFAIEALVKERDELAEQLKTADRQFTRLKESSGKADARAVELAGVIDTAKDDLDGAWVSADGTPLGEFLLEVHRALSATPVDALAEHDAELIEGLADTYASGRLTGVFAGRDDYTRAWLRERARQVREGEA